MNLTRRTTGSLGVALAMTLWNLWFLEPLSTKNMFDRYDLENKGQKESEQYKKLAKNFGKFHGISSLANLIAFCGAVAHGFILSSLLLA